MKSNITVNNTQQGFTLIEMAIVLVIIGLLLGGVLKGQELIENSKVKKAVNDFNGVVAAYNAYIDRYRRLPGDDGNLTALRARGGEWAAITQAGDNDGVIESRAAQTFTGRGESDNFWSHLKAAGLLKGNPVDTGVTALPRNPFGGLTGITNAIVMPLVTGLRGNKVCMSQVPGRSAVALDNQFDDGLPNNGSFRATLGVANTNTAPGASLGTNVYNESEIYTVCRIM